jgi:hypothetical protein
MIDLQSIDEFSLGINLTRRFRKKAIPATAQRYGLGGILHRLWFKTKEVKNAKPH